LITGSWGEYLNIRYRELQEAGENYIMRRFIMCTLEIIILVGWSSQGWWDGWGIYCAWSRWEMYIKYLLEDKVKTLLGRCKRTLFS
jgi:hypothetical protein